MYNLQAQQYQQSFNNIFTNPNLQIQSSFSFNAELNSQGATNSFDGFDATPRKRKFTNENNEADQANNSGKRQHIEISSNNHQHSQNHGIFSCFNGGCQHRTFSNESFSKLLNFFQNDQRNVLKGFCMNCGSSIFEELFHLYEHFRGFSQFCEQPNFEQNSKNQPPKPSNEQEQQIYIKKEVECNIMEETNIDHYNQTVLSDMDIDESIQGNRIDENTPKDQLEAVPITSMQPLKSPNELNMEKIDENAFQIKKETIEAHEDLNATVRLPSLAELETPIFVPNPDDFDATIRLPLPADLDATVRIPYEQHELSENENNSKKDENQLLVPIDPIFKLPSSSKSKNSLRKRAKSTYVESSAKKSIQNDKRQQSQATEDIRPTSATKTNSELINDTEDSLEMCFDFVSKKISDSKKNGSEKLKNLPEFSKNGPEDDGITFSDIPIDSLLQRIKNSAKPSTEGKKFVIEVEGLWKQNDQSKKSSSSEKSSRKVEEIQSKSKWKSSIVEYFSKVNGSKNSKNDEQNSKDDKNSTKKPSEIISEQQLNFSEQLMAPIREEKTPQKGKPAKRRSSGKESDEKAKSRRESLRNRSGGENKSPNEGQASSNRASVNLEQVHPKYQSKSTKTSQSEAKNEEKSTKTKIKSEKVESSNEKSLNSSTHASEITKHVPYTVDIEALIAKASSNLELVSIKDLYPWINQSITSIMFKTKSSLEILLNEFSLFSTYKCMNEFCYFFTTDFEEFKAHAKSHDSINNYCSYCLKNFDKSIDLCNHLDIVHKFDRFQCNKCMFRSCQKGYVDVHQRIHHSNEENCEVFKSPVQKLLKCDRSKCLPVLNKNREKFVMPYRCKTPRCRDIFFCKDNFRKHLEMESKKPACQDFLALICHQLSLIDHSRTTTSTEGVYQCLHCPYGTDNSNIFDHMALNHPHEFAYICKRVKPQKLIELNIISAFETVENSTSIEYIGTTTTEAKSFEGSFENLNSKNLGQDATRKEKRKGLVASEVVTIDA